MTAGLIILAVAGAVPLFNVGRAPLSDATPPPGMDISAETCGACHDQEYRQWRESRHAAAWSNALFAASFAREPMQWCVNCHAPLPAQTSTEASNNDGVSCAACHVRSGEVLTNGMPSARGRAAHPMRRESSLGEAEFCGGCHEFNFPVGHPDPVTYSPFPMQATLSEWQDSEAKQAGKTCQSCHISQGDHRMTGGHDVPRVRSAVSVSVRRRSGATVQIRLTGSGAGHRIPTGDPFRRFRVDLCADAGCEQVVRRVTFGRTIVPVGESWRIVGDHTIPARSFRQPEIEMEVDVEAALRAWRLVYQYAAPSTEGALSQDDRESEIDSGEILDNLSPGPFPKGKG